MSDFALLSTKPFNGTISSRESLKPGENMFFCTLCSFTSLSQDEVLAHFRCDHRQDEEGIKLLSSGDNEKMDGVSCFACAYCPFWSNSPDYLEYHTRLKHPDADCRNGIPKSDSKVISESTRPKVGGDDHSFHAPFFTDDLVKRDASVPEKELDTDICLPVMTSSSAADDEDVKFSDLQQQDKSVPNIMSNIFSASLYDCYDNEVETVNCFHCSYSSVAMDEVKFHHFSQHPTKSTCALEIHGSERNIKFFCVKETCEYSTTVCNAYEKHLMACLNINEKLSDALKERLHSSIDFVLDFHKRHGPELSPEFEDFVSSFVGLHVSADSCSTLLSCCIKGRHLDPHALNTCASVPQNLNKEIKLENDNDSNYYQASMSEEENKSDEAENKNGSLHSIFTATIKRENNVANSLVDHLISGNPDLENDIAGDLSSNTNGNFFPRETKYDSMESEEISNSEMDVIVENSPSPPPRGITKRLNSPSGQIEDLHSCHLCDLGFPSKTLLEKHSHEFHCGDWPFGHRATYGPCESCLNENADKIHLSKGDVHVEVSTHNKELMTKQYGQMLYRCRPCGINFGQVSLYHKHMKNHKGHKFTCSICREVFHFNSHFISHMRIHFSAKPFKCKECGKTFSQKHYLNKHIMKTHSDEKPFKCKECGKTFREKHYLNRHMGTHTDKKPFKCKECDLTVLEKNSLDIHMRKHTDEKPLICKECGQSFSCKGHLDGHMRTHTGEKPFICKECGQSFSRKGHLDEHMRTHTGEKPFKCMECGQTFREKGHLDGHMRTHTVEKPFKCEECGQTFWGKNSLNIHMRTHTGEKPFYCNECGQTFSQRGHLNGHMRIHTGEKPFKCKECGQTFGHKGTLNIHMRTHTGEKPFKCKECGQTFSQKGNFNGHMRTHTSEKPFKCTECGQNFSQNRYLKRHMRTHTSLLRSHSNEM